MEGTQEFKRLKRLGEVVRDRDEGGEWTSASTTSVAGFHQSQSRYEVNKKNKKHTYNFVSYQASTSKYFSRVHLNDKRNNAGCYWLGADAAYASDLLNKMLSGPQNRINFGTVEDYC